MPVRGTRARHKGRAPVIPLFCFLTYYFHSTSWTITHLHLYFLVGHGVRWFGGLTCDFAEVFRKRKSEPQRTRRKRENTEVYGWRCRLWWDKRKCGDSSLRSE